MKKEAKTHHREMVTWHSIGGGLTYKNVFPLETLTIFRHKIKCQMEFQEKFVILGKSLNTWVEIIFDSFMNTFMPVYIECGVMVCVKGKWRAIFLILLI